MTAIPRHRTADREPTVHVRELDWLMLVVMALCCLGLVMAVSVRGSQLDAGPIHVMKTQGFKLLIGLGAFLIAALTPMRLIRRAALPMFGLAVVACLLPHVFGDSHKGAARWIESRALHLQFQPVEPARFFLVLAVSWLLARAGTGRAGFRRGFLPAMGCALLLAAVLATQPDNGNAMLAVALAACLALVAGVRFVHFVPLFALGVAGMALVALRHGYVRDRLTGFLHTEPGSQVGLGLIAIGSGGVFGRGLGQGWMKMYHVPEAHNDFVFAIVGEEFGYLGSLFVLGSFTLFGYVCYRLVLQARDPFLRFIVCGYAFMICMQAAVNLLVVSGWAPAKGIDLPFVSTGGTNLVFCLAAVGLIGNAVRADRAGSFATADEVVVT